MSDGEHDATPDHWRASAPWERFSHRPTGPPRTGEGDTEKVGCHADGALSVADLIAKIGAPTADRHSRHRVADEADEPDEPAADVERHDVASDMPVDLQDTQVIDTPAYSLELVSELPDLTLMRAANYPNDDADQDSAPKAKRGRRPMLLAARSLAALFAVLALVLTGGAWQWSTSKNNRLNTISALDPHSRDIVDPGGQYGDEDFLIVGMDSRAGANANMGAGDTEDADGTRSDTVMLVNIPANRKRVVAVSFPRDLAITPIQCEAWNPETGKYGPLYDQKTGKYGPRMVYTETKLNSTFSFGGPKCLVKEIQKLSGLSINRFIAIDFVGFARMVEALGGVEVCSTHPAAGLRTGHGPGTLGTPGDRRANRVELRAGPPGHHRDQR